MDVVEQVWLTGGMLLLDLAVLGLLLQRVRIQRLEEALDEARASLRRLRGIEWDLQEAARDLRAALRVERARAARLEAQLALLQRWAVE